MDEENHLVKERISKIVDLKELGVNPYPYNFNKKNNSHDIIKKYSKLANEEKTKDDVSIGRVGHRDIRVKSRLFGRVRKSYPFLLRFTVTDAVPVEIYELHVDISRGG